MIVPGRRKLWLLQVEVVLFLGMALTLGLSAERLPFGRFWPWGSAASGVLALQSLYRLSQLRRLRRGLRSSRIDTLPSEKTPQKEGQTYLGKGFVWEAEATELLLELSESGSEVFARPAGGDLAGDWLVHGVGSDREEELFLPDALLNQHLFLMGAPGSGKTRGLELLIEQAVRRGDAVVVIDPKGDEALLDRTYDSSVRHGRGGQFRVLALPYPHRSCSYNPLRTFSTPRDVADRICSVMPRRGEAEAFRNFAWQFISTVTSAMHLAHEEVSLFKIQDYCFHHPVRLLKKAVGELCKDDEPGEELDALEAAYRRYCSAEGQKSSPEVDELLALIHIRPDYFGKISGALKTVLAKLTGNPIGFLLSPGHAEIPKDLLPAPRPADLSWDAIDREGLVVYFFLGSLIGPDSASATARMCLADLMSFIGRKYAFDPAASFGKRRLTVIVDEVADALAPESVNLLNKARGAGLSMVMAAQSLADLEIALGSAPDARRALANIGTFLVFRAANPNDAAFFSDKAGLRPLRTTSESESYEPFLLGGSDGERPDFSYRRSISTSKREGPLLPLSTLDRLPPGHFFGLWGGKIQKGLLPLLGAPEHLYSPLLKGDPAGGSACERTAPPASAAGTPRKAEPRS